MLRRPCGVVVDTLENLVVVVFQKLNFSLEFNLISRTIQFQIFKKPPDIIIIFPSLWAILCAMAGSERN